MPEKQNAIILALIDLKKYLWVETYPFVPFSLYTALMANDMLPVERADPVCVRKKIHRKGVSVSLIRISLLKN